MQEKQRKAKPAMPPLRYQKKFHTTKTFEGNFPIWTLQPQETLAKTCILYFHGGAYTSSFEIVHWVYFAKLIEKTHCDIVAPDYPLAPDYTASEVFAIVLPLYEQLVARYGASNIIIMGDSAGGGLGLALSQLLREKGLPQPAHTILLSPWLDVTLTNPEIAAIDPVDPVLNVAGLQEVGRAYAGNLGTHHYLASPLFGSLENRDTHFHLYRNL